MNVCMTKISVVIPSYRVKKHIKSVIDGIGSIVSVIYVVDDCCPEGTGKFVLDEMLDPRVVVIKNKINLGVGGAVIEGYKRALNDGCDIVIKLDGDGQMDPKMIPLIVNPILTGNADYVKGNRFFNIDGLLSMPKVRLIGNSLLSLITKLSSGYWNIFDPTNGYTAINAEIIKDLPLDKIDKRYFFESDLLFRLNVLRAVVVDVPMKARYADEISGLKIHKILFPFITGHFKNFLKRIFYNYYLRDMSLASIELPLGVGILFFGIIFGAYNWFEFGSRGVAAPVGTVVISGISILSGLQLILAFLAYDIASIPKNVRQSYAEIVNK